MSRGNIFNTKTNAYKFYCGMYIFNWIIKSSKSNTLQLQLSNNNIQNTYDVIQNCQNLCQWPSVSVTIWVSDHPCWPLATWSKQYSVLVVEGWHSKKIIALVLFTEDSLQLVFWVLYLWQIIIFWGKLCFSAGRKITNPKTVSEHKIIPMHIHGTSSYYRKISYNYSFTT